MNKFYMEKMIESFTEYINKRLRFDSNVENWGFSVTIDDKCNLILWIDYVSNFHSKDEFIFEAGYDEKGLQLAFETYFSRHLEELKSFKKRKQYILTENPKIKRLIFLIDQIYESSLVGGNLHIVLDDLNLDDDSIFWCIHNLELSNIEKEVASILLSINEKERENVLKEYWRNK